MRKVDRHRSSRGHPHRLATCAGPRATAQQLQNLHKPAKQRTRTAHKNGRGASLRHPERQRRRPKNSNNGKRHRGALFDAVADALDASTVKLLHKGKRLTGGDPLTPGMRVLCLGTTTQQKQAIAAQKSDPTRFEVQGRGAARGRAARRHGGLRPAPGVQVLWDRGRQALRRTGGPHRFEAEKLLRAWRPRSRRWSPFMDRGWTHRDGPARRPIMKKKQQEGGCLLGLQRKHGRTDLCEVTTGRRFLS